MDCNMVMLATICGMFASVSKPGNENEKYNDRSCHLIGMVRPVALLLAATVLCSAAATVAGAEQRSVLVLLDDPALEQSHSTFLRSLSARGYAVTIKPITDKALQLKSWDDWLYDKLVILGSSNELGGAVDVAQVVEFVDAGHDVLLAVDSGVSEELRELSQELGVDVDVRGHAVIDHFGFDSQLGGEDHAAVLADSVVQSAAVLPGGLQGPVLFRGIALSVPADSETAFLALSGSPTAYSGKPGVAQTDAKLAGGSMGLVALAQLRNNARVAVAGSLDMFSDAAFQAHATSHSGQGLAQVANEAFCAAISKWAFSERGVLRATGLSHRVVSGAEPGAVNPELYRINDEVEFSVHIQECNEGSCQPFKGNDVQVELQMLDPYVRSWLRHDGSGRFSALVKVPDAYGVFKWVVDYRRLGYSYIELTETVPIRPFKHHEYERFILQAYPYYASVASMMAGFMAVGAFFLYTRQAVAATIFAFACALRWMHAQFVKPLGTSMDVAFPIVEETVKAVVREWFAVLNRNLNTFSAFLLAVFTRRSYRATAASHAAEKEQAWHRWWTSASSTFNAIIEQEGLTSDAALAHGTSNGDSGGGAGDMWRQQQQQQRQNGASIMRQRSERRAPAAQRVPSRRGSGGGTSPAGSSWWRFWLRRDRVPAEEPRTSKPELRRGYSLFELPSGFAVSQMISGRGLLEDLRVGAEVGVGRAFNAVHRAINRMLWLDNSDEAGGGRSRRRLVPSDSDSPADLLARSMRRRAPLPTLPEEAEGQGAAAAAADAGLAAATAARPPRRRSRRPTLKSLLRSGRHWEEDLSVWTASDVILREGYPLEQHSMHRMPRHGARDVAFFQHGVLDTSLGWVSNGVVGSAAFAAFDAGFDVWLANSRSNAPRLHIDPAKQGSRYWRYSVNEMGVLDTSAEITHIHNTKMAELATPGRHTAAAMEQQQQQLRRAATDSLLDAMRWVDVRSGSGRVELGQKAQQAQGQGGEEAGGGQSREGKQEQHAHQQAQQQGEQAQQEAGKGPRGGSSSAGQQWWRRLTFRDAGSAQRDLPPRSAAPESAAPLRRTQSASDPFQHDRAQEEPAVPVSLPRSQQQQQQQQQQHDFTSGGASGPVQQDVLPYRLQAVGHSLGAATLLIYAVTCCMRGEPHRLRRLVLMSPAGFHPEIPLGLRPCVWIFPALVWVVDRLPGLKGRGLGLRLPSPLLRYIAFKFTMDLRRMPALNDLVKAGMRKMLSGDASQWDAALTMPHYSTYSMPALSMHCGAHFGQWGRDQSFRLFDYGSAAANEEHYEHYRLLDIPVDLLAGGADGIIPPSCVVRHVQSLRSAGVPCSFRILQQLGHMDMTLAVKGDIRLFTVSASDYSTQSNTFVGSSTRVEGVTTAASASACIDSCVADMNCLYWSWCPANETAGCTVPGLLGGADTTVPASGCVLSYDDIPNRTSQYVVSGADIAFVGGAYGATNTAPAAGSAAAANSTDPANWIQSGTPPECAGILSGNFGNQWSGDEIECHVCDGEYQLKCDLDTDIIGDDSVKCNFDKAGLGAIVNNAYDFDCNVDFAKTPQNQCDWEAISGRVPTCAVEPVRRILATWKPNE
ncbi:Dolichyl-diphosphooligosaccharide--protein glycosyltransferase subunit [Chlorella vulgaris]